MKWIIALLFVGLTTAFASVSEWTLAAKDSDTNQRPYELRRQLQYYGGSGYPSYPQYEEQYDPWENGTPIYYEFDDGWYEGTITGYFPQTGQYETTWSDGDVEYFTDYSIVDQMVYDFSNHKRNNSDEQCHDAWPSGTKIYVFEHGNAFWGQITFCKNGVYTTSWENGDVEYYDEGSEIDQMVSEAMDKANNGDAQDNFDSEDAEHDFTTQTYDEGTLVYKEFSDGWYQGVIISFKSGVYTVEWEDGEIDDYPDGEEMDHMVADAASIPASDDESNESEEPDTDNGQDPFPSKKDSKGSAAGQMPYREDQNDGKGKVGPKLLIVLAVLVGAILVVMFVRNVESRKRTRANEKLERAMEGLDEFKDVDIHSEPVQIV